jgi:phospholipase C
MVRLAIIAATVLTCLGAGAEADALPIDGIHNIQHVVVLMQENRSFDSYFGTYPGADGIPHAACAPDPITNMCIKPFHTPNDKNRGGPHNFKNAIRDIHGGEMNGFIEQAEHARCETIAPNCGGCIRSQPATCWEVVGYHDAREIPNYWEYANNFVLQDEMFASSLSWSQVEHSYLVSGWSARCGSFAASSCVNDAVRTSALRSWTDVTYLLSKANVTWRYYVYEGNEPDCLSDESVGCEPGRQNPKTPGIWNPLPLFTDVKEDNQLGNIESLNSFYSAVHAKPECGLANVTWVAPNQNVSEHPPALLSTGQAYITTLVNAIMRSPCWNTTAIFVSWDEWGGLYDHVVPPNVDRNGWGLRVPGLVISPYARTGYIDHQQLSHDAYLKFIEDDFLKGARLDPNTDGRPDPRISVREAASGLGNLESDFNFNQSPRAPLLLSPHPPPGPASNPP